MLLTDAQKMKIMREIPEMKRKQVASLQFRNDMIQARNRENYLNELQRLQGIISNTVPNLQEDRIKQRMSQLENQYKDSYYKTPSLYYDSFFNYLYKKK